MKVLKWGALAGAVVLTAALVPTIVAHGQSREPLVRSFDMLGSGGRLGVTVRDVGSDDKQVKTGVVIEDVEAGSAADKAGIKVGDVVTDFDGEHVRSTRQFTRLVRETPDGRTVPAVLSRDGKNVTVNVTPDRAGDDFAMRLLDPRVWPAIPPTPPPAPPAPRAPRTPRPPSLLSPEMPYDFPMLRISGRRLGITIESLDSQLAEYFGVKDGVLVKSVADGSSAQKAGLKAGDVITSINGTHVYETSDVNRTLDRIENDGEFTLEVVRDRKPQTLKGKLEARDTRVRSRVRTIV